MNVEPNSALSRAAIGEIVGGVGGTALFAIAMPINFLLRRNQYVNRDGGVENVDLTRDEGALASTSTVEGWWEVK